MDIIVNDPGSWHPSLDDVREYEDAVLEDPSVHELVSSDTVFSRLPNLVWVNICRILGGWPRQKPPFDPATMRDLFVILMGPRLRKAMPHFLTHARKSAYIFDAWPRNQERYRLFADACQIDHLFVSSSQGAAVLGGMLKSTACHWVPEGISPSSYFLAFRPERDIDVLQLGRRFNDYHNLVNAALVKNDKVYIYEKEPGHIIFPDRLALIEGLLRTKISICVPLSLSHPDRAGGIETMTLRYLQSMLSKCLIVGHAPAEMIQLFGYNPLIEIDFANPSGQLLDILAHMEDHEPLIEKNYRVVREQHTWPQRWKQIRAILRGETPATPPPAATAQTKLGV